MRLTPIDPRKLDDERNRRALSVSALADRSGISQQRLSKILAQQEAHHVMVRPETASQIAEALAAAPIREDVVAILPERRAS